MRGRRLFNRTGWARYLTLLVALAFFVGPTVSADPAACGNINCGGIVDLGDLSLLISYMFSTCPAPTPPCPWQADLDGYTGVSWRDLAMLAHKMNDYTYQFPCTPLPPVYPTSAGTYLNVLNEPVVPATATAITCTLMVNFTDAVYGLQLPIKFYVGNDSVSVAAMRTLYFTPDSPYVWARGYGSSALWVREVGAPEGISPRLWLFAAVDLAFPADPSNDRPVSIEYAAITHCGNPLYDFASPWLFKADPLFEVVTPTIGGTCCVGVRGNIDLKGIVDVSDLSALVAYLIGTGGLTCREAANVDALGIVDVSDLSLLISYLQTGTVTPVACP